MPDTHDIFIIGGGINGCGIARDAAGRGYKVTLAEMSDIGSATSSASSKLFHGGLRYLEYFEICLVREALKEREVLLRAMPHISWPMRFVLPYHSSIGFEANTPLSKLLNVIMPWMRNRRPSWLIRFGLFLYDTLGGRDILPGTKSIKLGTSPEGLPLKDKYSRAYEYSDCWVDDSRLVSLNARDAAERGANIRVRTKVISVDRKQDHWVVHCENAETGKRDMAKARILVNAAGPWVNETIEQILKFNNKQPIRLVRGSHIVTKSLYDHKKAYLLQGNDGRIIFVIPYENNFTLIGTTDIAHEDISIKPVCTQEEQEYLLDFANQYFMRKLTFKDIVWSYSGIRPLFDNGADNASALTRDYTLRVEKQGGAPILNIFGGKITTYRKLAEKALTHIGKEIPNDHGNWTATAPLPGGDFTLEFFEEMCVRMVRDFPFLSHNHSRRLVRAYGTDVFKMFQTVVSIKDLGVFFGTDLTQLEVEWLIEKEFARSVDDIIWRRSKLGLNMTEDQIAELDQWMKLRLG